MTLVKATSADHKQRFGSRCNYRPSSYLMILRPNRCVAAIATAIIGNCVSYVPMIPYLIAHPRLNTIGKGLIRNGSLGCFELEQWGFELKTEA